MVTLADTVAIIVGLCNLVCMILGGVGVWWRVSVSDKVIVSTLEDFQTRLERIEDSVFALRGRRDP